MGEFSSKEPLHNRKRRSLSWDSAQSKVSTEQHVICFSRGKGQHITGSHTTSDGEYDASTNESGHIITYSLPNSAVRCTAAPRFDPNPQTCFTPQAPLLGFAATEEGKASLR